MIGLGFLAVGLLWLAFSGYLATRLPKWLGVVKPVWRRLLGVTVFLLLLVGPFVDHIVGMRQFEKLCAEQTRLEISPKATNTKRAIEPNPAFELLDAYVIPINQQVRRVFDLDTGEQVAQYKYFSTPGGRIGPLIRLGGLYTCSAIQRGHIDQEKYAKLKVQTNLTYGEAK